MSEWLLSMTELPNLHPAVVYLPLGLLPVAVLAGEQAVDSLTGVPARLQPVIATHSDYCQRGAKEVLPKRYQLPKRYSQRGTSRTSRSGRVGASLSGSEMQWE